jgi:hypothetical protein
MLTPAEQLGLSGMALSARVRLALHKIPEEKMRVAVARIAEEAEKERLVYLRDGVVDVIRLLACPMTVLPEQLSYVHTVSLTLHRALKRLPDLYLRDPRVRAVLQVPPEEEAWLLGCWGKSQHDDNPVFGRLDAVVDFTSSHWKDTLRFLEPNMSGIGGLHMVPMSERIIANVVFPLLREQDHGLEFQRGPDIRDLLMQGAIDHLDALGRPLRTLCFIEPKYAGTGPDEQERLAHYFHTRYAIKVLHADPAELAIQGNEVVYEGEPIDLGYRDYSVPELLELHKSGVDVEPMRRLLSDNRMISSIAAELDQKACWEIFTDPSIASDHFTTEERRVFRRHVLWTRIVSARKTTLPHGEDGELLEYAKHERETLVLKPNRSYGGDGVILGAAQTDADWTGALERALAQKERERWVLQALTPIPIHEFPIIDGGGKVKFEPFYTVWGFAPTTFGVASLGRASQKQVVNVAQRGGLCSLAVGNPSAATIL